jgi:hypothetical protein
MYVHCIQRVLKSGSWEPLHPNLTKGAWM